jgi:hypothetical protein
VTLEERVVELHRAFDAGGIPHAVGGAIALGYWTLNPRGTRDIDINIFVPSDRCEDVLAALPAEVERPPDAIARIKRDSQIRLRWGDTPVDLFFDSISVHEDAAGHTQTVPFADVEIRVIGPVELAIFKAMYDRNRDWPDIEGMIRAGTLDVDAVRKTLSEMFGPDDRRLARLEEVVQEAAKPDPGDMESPWRPSRK